MGLSQGQSFSPSDGKGYQKFLFFFFLISEDCTDCFGSQKKDEPNDKEKKEEEDSSTSVHHSIIETWDWGRQPGEKASCVVFRRVGLQTAASCCAALHVWLSLFYASVS